MKVFISYRRLDVEFAEKLYSKLKDWGHEPWIDIHDIKDNENWDDSIHNGMRQARAVIGVLTPDSLESRNVLDEWGWALSNERRLILLWFKDFNEEAIPPRYIRIQRLDIRQNPDDLTRLQRALESPGLILPEQETADVEPVTAETEAHQADTHKDRVLFAVYDSWIEGLLKPALKNQSFSIELGVQRDAVLQHVDFGDYELPTSTSIPQLYNDIGKQLLILGQPGSGKTIMLLQIAEYLIDEAFEDIDHLVPVVFNLSNWNPDQPSFEQWVIDELKLRYGLAVKQGRRWVRNEQIVLLLDGLDEVQLAHRDTCVEAINTFRAHFPTMPMVVTSRIADYDMLSTRLNMRAAIVLKPLTIEQIDRQLSAHESMGALQQGLQQSTALQNLAESPFLLNSMMYTYADAKVTDLPLMSDVDMVRKTIFSEFVKKCLTEPGIPIPTTLEEIVDAGYTTAASIEVFRAQQIALSIFFGITGAALAWSLYKPPSSVSVIPVMIIFTIIGAVLGVISPTALLRSRLEYAGVIQPGSGYTIHESRQTLSFFAFRMTDNGRTVLYIEDIQPSWLTSHPGQRTYKIILLLIFIVIGAGVTGTFSHILLDLWTHESRLLWLTGIASIVGGVFGALHIYRIREPIKIVDKLSISYRRLLGVSLVTILLVLIIRPLINNGFQSSPLFPTLCLGFFTFFALVFIFALRTRADVQQRFLPAQSMGTTLGSAFANYAGTLIGVATFIGLIGMLLLVQFAYYLEDIAEAADHTTILIMITALMTLYVIAIYALAFIPLNRFFIKSGRDYIRHRVLRYMLTRSEELPKWWISFLDYCVAHGIMRRAGGGYMFIHRMLQEYFADNQSS